MMLNSSNEITKIRTTRELALLIGVLGLFFLVSCVGVAFPSFSYAKTSSTEREEEQPIRTLDVKMHIEKSILSQGNTQSIEFQVNDQKSRQPIGGSIISATVVYADGQTVRQVNVPTDASGNSVISWRIEQDAPVGRYRVSYLVSQTGYVSSGGMADNSLYFTVIPPSNSVKKSESAEILSFWHIS
jgi:hypothetical protein